MTTGSLLWRGMIVGFVAALLSFGLLKLVGEPAVDRAIAFESAMDDAKAKAEHDVAVARGENPPPYEEEPELVSRPVQAGIGLFTGVSVYSIAFGGLFALAFAVCYGRIGDWSPRVTAAIVALCGFIAVYAVPIIKYPANPPSIGNPDTISLRTAIYFGMILLSLGAMIAAWNVRNRLIDQFGGVERDANRRRRLYRRGCHLRDCHATAQRGSGRLPGRGALAIPYGFARRSSDHVDGAWPWVRRLGPARLCRGESGSAADGLLRRAARALVTARLDLMAHGASEATRAARFPDDEPLEGSAAQALQALRGRVRPYAQAFTAPACAARETAAALGLNAKVEPALRDCDYGRWRGLASKDVAKREPDAFAAWLGDPMSAPHGGESFAALIERVSAWLTHSLARYGATLAVTHAPIVRAAIVNALGAGPSAFARVDVAPLSLARLSSHAGRWNLVALGPMGVLL
jgi:broad specificity phosphatase PhoE